MAFPAARLKKSIFVILSLAACALVAGEAIARWGLGLGAPPLSIAHPRIEYMLAPNQDVMRFGHRQVVNEYGMRSPPLAGREYARRILALGDSVVNGGGLTDHARLATTIAAARLSKEQPTFVGNVSAGSWGPGNLRAYLEEFGFLGAEAIVLVLSSHDLTDQPTFAPLNPLTHPTRPPRLALEEAFLRYLPRYLPHRASAARAEPPPAPPGPTGAQDLGAILDMAAAARVRVCLIQHLTKSELSAGPQPAHFEIGGIFRRRALPVLDFGASLRALLAVGRSPYSDDIHINDAGQAALADALLACDRAAAVPQ
ncbi:MAG: hypothetical protein JWN93_3779 [Hyphomicrobiales bacterium]|nr:hypothetical protein [Hyphomicrobiales bacterium]